MGNGEMGRGTGRFRQEIKQYPKAACHRMTGGFRLSMLSSAVVDDAVAVIILYPMDDGTGGDGRC